MKKGPRVQWFKGPRGAGGRLDTARSVGPPWPTLNTGRLRHSTSPTGGRRYTALLRPLAPRPLGPSAPLRPAFTLIEVLIVIVVIGVLIAVLGLVGSRVIRGQKVNLTLSTMRGVKLAIDQFASENPLGGTYDRRAGPTFGPYPPYQIVGTYRTGGPPPTNVREAVESRDPALLGSSPAPGLIDSLRSRLWRDLSNRQGGITDWVRVLDTSQSQFQSQRHNNDIRALYVYLRVHAGESLTQVPPSALQPLDPSNPEYVNPKGTGPNPGLVNNTWLDVLGIHDAWGVPLDYFLYVKLEFSLPPAGSGAALGTPQWRVVERVPVLRSRGIQREVYDRWLEQLRNNSNALPLDGRDTWILSDALPAPQAQRDSATFWSTGTFLPNSGGPEVAGWARAVGEGDLVTSVSQTDPRAFGYVP